jgi:hypothetical protein
MCVVQATLFFSLTLLKNKLECFSMSSLELSVMLPEPSITLLESLILLLEKIYSAVITQDDHNMCVVQATLFYSLTLLKNKLECFSMSNLEL